MIVLFQCDLFLCRFKGHVHGTGQAVSVGDYLKRSIHQQDPGLSVVLFDYCLLLKHAKKRDLIKAKREETVGYLLKGSVQVLWINPIRA
jgi:hypothetical protein